MLSTNLELDKILTVSGGVLAMAVWLRQYLVQVKLTNAAVRELREDNEVLRSKVHRYEQVYGVIPDHPEESPGE